jgi:hypothetical protein
MAFTRIFTAPYQVDAAGFRAWGSALCAAIESVGVIKTEDTGQIDWASVATPSSASQMMGYEIRRFTDSIQATNPIFIKFEFGAGTSSNQRPCIRVSVGRGSDGAGNLTGDMSSYFYLPTTSGSSTPYSSYISSDGGRLNLALWVEGVQANAFWIERFKDSNGDPTATGVNICSCFNHQSAAQSTAMQGLPAEGSAYPALPIKWQCALSAIGGTYNTNIGFFPIHPNLGCAGNPDLGGLAFYAVEVDSSGTFYTINLYGVNHTYVAVEYLSTSINAVVNLCSALVRCE